MRQRARHTPCPFHIRPHFLRALPAPFTALHRKPPAHFRVPPAPCPLSPLSAPFLYHPLSPLLSLLPVFTPLTLLSRPPSPPHRPQTQIRRTALLSRRRRIRTRSFRPKRRLTAPHIPHFNCPKHTFKPHISAIIRPVRKHSLKVCCGFGGRSLGVCVECALTVSEMAAPLETSRSCTITIFCQGIAAKNFAGNVRKNFRALDNDGNYIINTRAERSPALRLSCYTLRRHSINTAI